MPDRQWLRLQQLLGDVLLTDDEVSIASVAAAAAADLLDASSVSVGRFDSERGALQVLVNLGDLGSREQVHPVNESYPMTQRPSVAEMANTRRSWTVLTGDPGAVEEQAALAELGKESAMACPILIGDRMWGELYVTRRVRRRFCPDEVAVAETVASVLALALHRQTGTEELRRLAYADALTGLGNRRRADELVDHALDVGRDVVVALFDVDNLKSVNDQDGHAAGDSLLQQLAVLLAEAAAAFPDGHAVRLGGDEFALVVLDADTDRVASVAEGIITAADRSARVFGLSAGVASSRDLVGLTPASRAVFRLADAALYRAKRSGGRRLMTQWTTHEQAFQPVTSIQQGADRGLAAASSLARTGRVHAARRRRRWHLSRPARPSRSRFTPDAYLSPPGLPGDSGSGARRRLLGVPARPSRRSGRGGVSGRVRLPGQPGGRGHLRARPSVAGRGVPRLHERRAGGPGQVHAGAGRGGGRSRGWSRPG